MKIPKRRDKEEKIIPIKENQVYFLFRRGKKEHIEALYERGEVHINTIDFIRTCDKNNERSDKEDGINYRKYIGNAKVTIANADQNSKKGGYTMETNELVINYDNEIKGNIYCLTGIYSDDLMNKREDITFETKAFGESVIFIYNPKIFLERIFSELKRLGYNHYNANQVSYYPNDYTGPVNFFKKHEKLRPQKEFRIFIQNENKEPIKINIGSLKDIASFNKSLITLKYTDEKEQKFYI